MSADERRRLERRLGDEGERQFLGLGVGSEGKEEMVGT